MTPGVVQALRDAADRLHTARVSIATLAQAHGPAAQGSLLVLLATACLLPIPGSGGILGVGVGAVALAMWRGRTDAALPDCIAHVEMSQTWAKRVLNALATIYAWAARVARTRAVWMVPASSRGWVAGLVAFMAVGFVLPIPFGNVLAAVVLILLGIGLVFRDGVLVALSVAAAVVSTVALSALLSEAVGWGMEWLDRIAV